MIKREKVEEKVKAQSRAITAEKLDTIWLIALRRPLDNRRRVKAPRRANLANHPLEKAVRRVMESLGPTLRYAGIIGLGTVGTGLTVSFSILSDNVGRSLGQEKLMMLTLWISGL